MEIKTLENMFIESYENLKNELDLARKRISELEQEKESAPTNDNEPVVYKSFSKETCYLQVKSLWEFEKMDEFQNLTASDVKDIIDNDEKLKAYAKLQVGDYDRSEIVLIKTKVFPYSAVFQGKVILIDVYQYYSGVDANVCVLADKNKLSKHTYYDIKEKERLYEYGLTVFKKELEELYKKKMKKEAGNE